MNRKTRFLAAVAAASLFSLPIAWADEPAVADGAAAPSSPSPATGSLADGFAKAQAEAQPENAAQGEAPSPEAKSPEQLAKEAFDAALALFNAADFQGARDGFLSLLSEHPVSPVSPDARGYLALSLVELGQNRQAERKAADGFFNMSEGLRRRLAPTFAALAESMERFDDAVAFTAQMADDAATVEERDNSLETIAKLCDGRLTANQVAALAQQIPQKSKGWPIVQFRLALLQAHLGATGAALDSADAMAATPGAEQAGKEAEDRIRQDFTPSRAKVQKGTIGVLVPLSGKYGAFGKIVKIGLELATKGSQSVRLVYRDTEGDPLKARVAVRQLVEEEGAIALIGPVLTTEAPYAALEAESLGVPLMGLASNEGLPRYGRWIFRNMLTRSAQASALADYAMGRLGYKNFAVLYPEFSYGTDLANAFWDEVDRRGGQMKAAESYAIDQTTFRDQARKLVGRYYLEEREEFVQGRKDIDAMKATDFKKRKMKEDLLKKLPPIVDFDALFIPDSYQRVSLVTPALAVEDIITNACDRRDMERIAETAGKKSKDMKTVLLLGSDGWNFPELVERGGKFVQCAVFVDAFYADAPYEETQNFVKAWTRATSGKIPPMLLGAASHDSGRILRDIIERVAPESRQAMRDELLKVKEFPGACGPTGFDASGEVQRPLFLLTIDRNGITQVPDAQPDKATSTP